MLSQVHLTLSDSSKLFPSSFFCHEKPRAMNTERFVNRLNTLDGAQEENRQNNPALIDEHRKEMLNEIQIAVNDIKNTKGIQHNDFIGLFDCVIKLKTLNVHDNPRWDQFWKIEHTSHLQIGLGYVRHEAANVLHENLARLVIPGRWETIIFTYEAAEKLELFTLPRANWTLRSPSSLEKARDIYCLACHRTCPYTSSIDYTREINIAAP